MAGYVTLFLPQLLAQLRFLTTLEGRELRDGGDLFATLIA